MSTLVPVRRQCCIRERPAVIRTVATFYHHRGDLLTPWGKMRLTRHSDQDVTATFEVREWVTPDMADPGEILPRPPLPLRFLAGFARAVASAFHITAVRRLAYLALTIGALLLAGHLLWTAFADEIATAVRMVLKVVLALAFAAGALGISSLFFTQAEKCTGRH